jgi:hypothetical protein
MLARITEINDEIFPKHKNDRTANYNDFQEKSANARKRMQFY